MVSPNIGIIASSRRSAAPVSGMAIWYDASDATTFSYSSSNIISQWSDKSGNSRNATQSTTSSQPTRVTNVINGLPVVRFDGTNDYLSFTNIFNADTSFTVFWILRPRDAASGIYQPSFSSQTVPDTDNGALHYVRSNYAASYPFFGQSWGSYDGVGSYSSNTAYLMEFIANGSVFKVFKSGVQESTDKTIGSAPSYNNTNIAAQVNPGRYSPFDFGEILIYTTALSAADVTANRAYLNAKWGL